MTKFRVIFIESYEHVVTVDANSYLEAEEKADHILSKDTSSYCAKDPNWYLDCVEKAPVEKRSRKACLVAA